MPNVGLPGMKKHTTDAEYVESVRRLQPLRRRIGTMFTTVAGSCLAVGIWGVFYLGPKILMLLEVLRDREREAPADFDSTLAFGIGAIVGLMTGITLVVSTIAMTLGLFLRRPDRTADLLLECWDQLAAKREAATSLDPDFS